jgi:glutathione reductase (NADPH)
VSELDVVVIGTGSSGRAAAVACARAGKRVAVVDERPYGGTCELRGCDPKKVLVGAAELVDWAQRMRESGVTGELQIDWPQLMNFKRTFTDPVPREREAEFTGLGIATYHGAARFADPNSIEVDREILRANHIVLACGARPATLEFPGRELLITSTEFLDLERMPPRIAFIGGGYIAFEFAHVAARAGARPVILQRGPRVLTGFDPVLVDDIVELSESLGIAVRVNVDVRSIEKRNGGLRVDASCDGSDYSLECDLAVHAAGRVPDIDGLALDVGRVERGAKGVIVNEFLQSRTNPSVYAVGDCADGGGLPLTPTAGVEGEVAARNILQGNRETLDFSGLASVVYSIPALAMTGLTYEQACEGGVRFRLHEGDATQWYSSRRIRARRARYRLLVDEEKGTILGAHVLGPHAEELINVFCLAIRARIPIDVLQAVLFAYPTASSDVESMLQS